MANTYTQLYIQIIFAVKGRQNLLPKAHRAEIFRYMAGVIKERSHKVIIINGVSDHVHLFIGYNPAQSIAKLVNEVKTATTKFIKKQAWMHYDFAWQKGYGAFSYARSQVDRVYSYIENQEAHHKKKSFSEEYREFLENFEIEYQEEYLFEFYEDKQ